MLKLQGAMNADGSQGGSLRLAAARQGWPVALEGLLTDEPLWGWNNNERKEACSLPVRQRPDCGGLQAHKALTSICFAFGGFGFAFWFFESRH
jgi:hypothetical protein